MVGTAGIVGVGDGSGVDVMVAVGICVFVETIVAVFVEVAVGKGVAVPHPIKLTEIKITNNVVTILFAGFNVIKNPSFGSPN